MARTKKEDTKKDAIKTAAGPEAPEQPEDTAPAAEAPEQTGEPVQDPDMLARLPNPCVYCGPSVKGVALQYTTYQGGIPDALKKFIGAHPEALGMIVSTGEFQTMRRRLETPGTPEAELYKAVKARL